MTEIQVIPMKAALGAEVRCGDLRAADDAAIRAIRQAWLDHLVVVLRGQQLTDADLVHFGARFGEFQYSNPLVCHAPPRALRRERARRVLHRVVINGTKPYLQKEEQWQT
jgi:hypothetical protein